MGWLGFQTNCYISKKEENDKRSSKLFMKNKNNKKTSLLTRILHDKKGIYVTTAMKIVIAIVLGITTLTGTAYVMKDVVIPQTTNKLEEAFEKDYSAEGGGAGGSGLGGGSTTIRNGTIPGGCSYTPFGETIRGAGGEIPLTPSAGDVYKEEDYVYTYGDHDETGWSVTVADTSKSSYGMILSEIADKPVTTMYYTFDGCESLTTAPVIPDSVTDMEGTFSNCENLTTAPTIPGGVTNLSGTFAGCTGLTAAPTIPGGVTDMTATFCGCTSLTTAPSIPDNIINMIGTFSGCASLTAAPAIPDGVTNMTNTFSGCASLTAAPAIPDSVTNMPYTFCDCTSLSGSLECNADPEFYACCLSNTQITLITGSCSQATKDALLATINPL